MRRRIFRVAPSILALIASASAFAADGGASAHECAAIPEPEQRLACYDRMYPPAPQDPATIAEKARKLFGLSNNAQQARKQAQDAEPDRVEARLAGLGQAPGGGRMFTLDNGQVWVETESTFRGHVVEGNAVVVRKAAFGTFMLVTPAKVSLRVRRMR